ncbi:hypothetical protein HY494_01620 [Candidatus Woesearchaeota archaeon]|nr:hypothetical protein [Candidatus Woesearchaeota archaeon]
MKPPVTNLLRAYSKTIFTSARGEVPQVTAVRDKVTGVPNVAIQHFLNRKLRGTPTIDVKHRFSEAVSDL